ncbi:MAG: peptidylprolyl isomerase, partial [Gammaproteobacteria bacterium]
MLQQIRDRAQGPIVWTIVGLIIVTFALFGLGSYLSGTSTDTVATVNGESISQNEFQRAYRNYQDRLRQMLGDNYRPDLFNPAMMKQEVLNGLINQRLLVEYLDEHKIYPADQLIAAEVHRIPAFKDERGAFSNEQYQTLLRRQGMSPVGFEADLARDIGSQQIAGLLQNTNFVTASELALYQRLKNQQRDMGYLLLSQAAYLATAQPTEADIDAYYQEHKAEFVTPEQVKLNYVELDLAKRSAQHDVDEARVKDYYAANRASYIKQAEQRKASHILLQVNQDMDDATAEAKLRAILADYK